MRTTTQGIPEVLAPAGSPDALTAAVRCGADAVYLGAELFSARANARNFGRDELRDAVRYCHARGVKVYLALNTLIAQDELRDALSLAEYACSLPVDAVIVQDTGLSWLLHRCAPSLKLSASTQMSIHTPAGVRALSGKGFSRVVLARELSLEEIQAIADDIRDSGIELESFVHGALCMSVSGQCYFSAMLGSRSGNRGQCAQPCRLPFSTPGGTGHDLSLKDLSMIARVRELSDAGVQSVKIEGRMKRPEYVAAAVTACRLAADGKPIPPSLTRNLAAVFSRSGFTCGYPDGELGRSMFGIRSKEDVTEATANVLAELQGLYRREFQHIPVDFHLEIHAGSPLRLTVSDGVREISVEGAVPETARTKPVEKSRCREQLQKTGGTPFLVHDIRCDLDNGLAVSASALNALRRDALTALENARSEQPPVSFTYDAVTDDIFSAAPPVHTPQSPLKLRARFPRAETVPPEARQCELVYLPLTRPASEFSGLLDQGMPVAVELPRGLFGRESWARNQLKELFHRGIQRCRAGNLGAAMLALELGFQVHGGFSLNIFNTPSLLWHEELGLADAELSIELTLSQAAVLGGNLPRGMLLYGRIPMMLTRNCPAANGPGGCRNCKEPPLLTDRRGVQFPVVCGAGCSEILNSTPIYMADRMDEVKGQDFGVLQFTVENSVETGEILSGYLHPIRGEKPHGGFTRGLFYRGVR